MGWFQKLIYGVDLEAEQKRSDTLDRAIEIENQKDYGPGGTIYNRTVEEKGVEAANKQYDEVQARTAAGRIDVEAEVDEAFWEGWEEGQGNIKRAVAGPFDTLFSIIPWQLWAAALVYVLLVYMGGAKFLKGLFSR